MPDCPTPSAQDSVLPQPGSGTRARAVAGPATAQVEAIAADLARAYEEMEALRAELESEREAALELATRAAHAEGIAEGYRQAMAQVLESRATLSPVTVPASPRVDVHQPVHRDVRATEVDMSTEVHQPSVDMKGGRGEATAKPKAELQRAKWRDDKKRQRAEKKAAAEGAREMSTSDTSTLSTSDVHLGHVHPVDTMGPVAAPVAPAIRRKPKWMEDATPSPDKAFFAWFTDERHRRFPGAVVERRAPARWPEWHATALAACGGDEEKLRTTCRSYLDDAWAQRLERPCPASVLISDRVWPKHVPGQHDGAVLTTPVAPADARRRADLNVGRQEAVGGPCATGCGREAVSEMWGHRLCTPCWHAADAGVHELSAPGVAAWVESRRAQAQGVAP
ncbi:hypothetical protein [Myxococcus eversor]|uniref:hypothetical protein n=1 Tax=Myxococcus eversor TaxID=2709661 RepID=UPI0013D7869C|nr:hypothetical protein [Myxococcus eversor]